MTVISAALTVLLMVVTGWAMFHRLARFLLAGRYTEFSEVDLMLIGILPGLALVGTLATYLALLHLLRFGFVLAVMIAILYVTRREIYALLVAICRCVKNWLVQARQGNLFPIIAVGVFFVVLAMALRLATIPAENVDIWVFHIPLAQSIVAHHGFVYPLIPKMLFYSSQPLLFELLYSTAMLAVPHFIAANAVNVAILFGFVFLLLSFAGRARDIQFLVLCGIFFWWQNFLVGATQPMIDLPRSCFSAAAYLFAYRYACNFRGFDLIMSALMAGAAVAGKYTELMTPIIICLTLAPLMIVRRRTWAHMIPAALVFTVVAGVWYIKNAILLGNPIFPFLFGHPGLSDQWMASYLQEMARPFDIADRIYSTDLRTAKGWRDFATVMYNDFRALKKFAVVAILGLALPQPSRWVLPLWSFALFVFWYAVMFNGTRWAITAMLMTLASGYITWTWVADRLAAMWNPAWPTMALEAVVHALKRRADPWKSLASLIVVAFLATGLVRLKEGYGHSWLPSWMDTDLVVALLHPARMDRYLENNRPNYSLYHYIGEHNLAQVLQPFDNGGTFDASSYNGGRANVWVLYYQMLPANLAQTDDFIAHNGVHYFVDREPIKPLDVERLGAAHVALAKAVIGKLKSHSQLILRDGDMFLYAIHPQDAAR